MRDLFFFFKQNTAYELRISDWSSDVCSSDLNVRYRRKPVAPSRLHLSVKPWKGRASGGVNGIRHGMTSNEGPFAAIWSRAYPLQIGRASCRERVCQYV